MSTPTPTTLTPPGSWDALNPFPDNYRCGYIGIVGRPNTGKSSLFNALVGTHLSGVSAKAQTTRIQVMGWLNLHEAEQPGQLVFLDTPGFMGSDQSGYQAGLKQHTLACFEFADVLLMMIDSRGWRRGDEEVLALIRERFAGPALLLMNKIDLLPNKSELLPLLATNSQRHDWQEIVPISVQRNSGLNPLVKAIWHQLPQSPPYYSVDESTLQSREAIVVEHIRENLYRHLHQEIPYRMTVNLRKIEENEDNSLHIYACIRSLSKHRFKIIIGRSGKTLALIRRGSEKSLQEYFGSSVKVFVHLDVVS